MDEFAGQLASIDYVIIGTYMAGVLLVGSFFGRYIHSSGDLFLAGRSLPFWAIGMSIVVSDIGAIDLIAGAGGAYEQGIAQANFDWIGSVPAVLIAAFVFLPYYWRAGVYTVPEFLGRRYNSGTQWVQAVMLLFFMAANVAVFLWMSAVFLNEVLGWSYLTAIWATVIVVGIYTVTGGLAAVVMTDVMQLVVMFVGSAALLILSMWEVGGWSGLTQTILEQGDKGPDFFRLLVPHLADTEYPWTGMVFSLGLIMSTSYYVANQAVMQRALGARTEWDAKAGMIFAGLFKLFIPVLVFIPGLAARAIDPNLGDEADKAIPMLVNKLLPAGLKGLMFAAFLAALMSSVDSYLNSCATVFMSDIYDKIHRRFAGQGLTDRQGVIFGRTLTAIILIGAALVAPLVGNFGTIYEAIQTLLSLFQGPTLAILLLGIFWRGATPWGGFAGLTLGVVTTIVLNLLGNSVFPSNTPFLFVSFWSFFLSLGITIFVSLLTPPAPPEKLVGLVYSQVLTDSEAQQALRNRVDSD